MKCPHCRALIVFQSEDDESVLHVPELNSSIESGRCPGCKELIIIHKMDTAQGERIDLVYPRMDRREPLSQLIPEEYRKDFREAENIVDQSATGSAALSRRLLQRILREHFGIKHKSLAAEIDEFLKQPDTPQHIADEIDAIRNVGNFAAHAMASKDTGEVVDVEPAEAEWLLAILESLLIYYFRLPVEIRERREALNRKLISLGKPPMKSK